MSCPTYPVTVTREDNLWVSVVTDGLAEGTVGAADFEHFAEVDPGMREVIADLTSAEPDHFDISWRYEFSEKDHTALIREFQAAERVAAALAHWRDRARRRLVGELNGQLSQRALADLIGLSHQRIHQISHEPEFGEIDLIRPAPALVDALVDIAHHSPLAPAGADANSLRAKLHEVLEVVDG